MKLLAALALLPLFSLSCASPATKLEGLKGGEGRAVDPGDTRGAAAPGAPHDVTQGQPGSTAAPVGAATSEQVAAVWLMPPGREPVSVAVEVVSSPALRQKGLMFRKSMAADAGMLFVFPEEKQLTFWMRNTYLPLDMVFIRADHTVLGVVENAVPQTDDPRRVDGASQFVLEVNAGYARAHGVGPGTRVRFSGVAPATR